MGAGGVIEWCKIVPECFKQGSIYFTLHAKREMELELFGAISISEVLEAANNPEVLKDYPDDQPYPSALLLGFTNSGRPLHLVAAFDARESRIIIVTIYQPDPELWFNFRRRK